MKTRTAVLLVLATVGIWSCGDSPVGVSAIDEGPDTFIPPGVESSSGDSSSVVSTGSQGTRVANCHPQIEFVLGACADGSGESVHATIGGSCFTPNSEVALVMSPNTNGWIKGGRLCNGAVFEIGEPFVLPPTWAKTDADGNFLETVTGAECLVEALDVPTCHTSNVVTMPPVGPQQ